MYDGLLVEAKFHANVFAEFGLDKCAIIHTKGGKLIDSPVSSNIPLLTEEDSYRYLGILECTDIMQTAVKQTTRSEYYTRTRNILKSGISAKNVASAISTFATPVMRYTFGVIRWTKAELRGID